MTKSLFTLMLLVFVSFQLCAQNAIIKGQLQDENTQAVSYANVALYNSADSSLVKVEISDDAGVFNIANIKAGSYFVKASFVGYQDYQSEVITLGQDETKDLGVLKIASSSVDLTTATVKASRVMVEVKADRTVFNVEGTINSTGSDAVELLRKAPGVTVDNNDNINVLGRSGVLLYVDGKRLPLAGDDLSNYLKNLPADQIDRIDIITNPGAKYEAEGNAGIIDIRLKKDKSQGANGQVRATGSQGRYGQGNINFTGNYRGKKTNVFATLGAGQAKRFNEMEFLSFQNNLVMDEINNSVNQGQNLNYRVGADYYINKNSTIGFLVNGGVGDDDNSSTNIISIGQGTDNNLIDSVLNTISTGNYESQRNAFNVNYRFDDKKSGKSLNVDLDYGKYVNDNNRFIPNQYFDATQTQLLSVVNNEITTRSDIDIYTGKLDYEQNLLGGKLGMGLKYSQVVSDNTFLFSDEVTGSLDQNDTLSNIFVYDEKVYAGYVNYAGKINEKVSYSAGLRAEQTDALGDLQVFVPTLSEDPVDLNYLKLFPSAGLSWQVKPMHSLNFNYGRRINRPDYNVLNPFNNRLSELSYEKGNPRLNPEIVNNFEVGYTMNYRYNFKLAYSKTTDQITRLIAPDEDDPRAGFISWENLAEQTVYSANISAPMQLNEKWNLFCNISGSYIDNQATYENGGVVDVQTFTYSLYMQNTITLPKGFKGEISGWYSGPGVWGGVFLYESNWSLNIGLQRKFLNEKLNVRLSANDLFYQSGWNGASEFNGLYSEGSGRWDSRRVSLSVGYNFGNQNVKSRNRKTGIEDEESRLGSE